MTATAEHAKELRRNKQFQWLWVGSAVSALGSDISALAFPLLVLSFTGSPAMAGAVSTVGFTTRLLFSLPGGVWGDRWDRRRVLLSCEVIRAISVGTVALAAIMGRLTIAHIIAAAAILGAAGALFTPAREATVRSIVKPELLTVAYAQEHVRTYGVTLIGPPTSGLLFGWGKAIPFVADAITYLISATCLMFARIPRRAGAPAVTADAEPTMRAEIAEAARWLWNKPLLRAICLFTLVVNLGSSMLLVPVIVLVQDRGGSPTVVGIVMGAMGVGGLVGALVAPRLAGLIPINHLVLAICMAFAVLVLAIAAPFGPYWPALPMMLAGLLGPVLAIPVQVYIAEQTPAGMMARVQSMVEVGFSALLPVGPALGGFLTGGAGPTRTIVIAAGLIALVLLAGLSSSTLRRTDVATAGYPGSPTTTYSPAADPSASGEIREG
ncbi:MULTISPECIES: MFS transporter [Nocardia]|uniref:MFS transporter n=1 Tax=Nocardia abscessus TaxID=120957 RepID=UPI001894BD31|nr:MFS transporter [Nocardia abscessus]MBF6473280.1 MFS transporter [Nocardia abscessus]